MLNFALIFLYTLSGAYASVDVINTETLNAQQSLAKFEQIDTLCSRTLRISSVKNNNLALEFELYSDLYSDRQSTRKLFIFRKGKSQSHSTLTTVGMEVEPSCKHHTCKVSVESHDEELMLRNYAREMFFTRSVDLACMHPPQIDISKRDHDRTILEYKLPQDIDGTDYYLCLSILLSDLNEIELTLTNNSPDRKDERVFMLIYKKDQMTPQQVLF